LGPPRGNGGWGGKRLHGETVGGIQISKGFVGEKETRTRKGAERKGEEMTTVETHQERWGKSKKKKELLLRGDLFWEKT